MILTEASQEGEMQKLKIPLVILLLLGAAFFVYHQYDAYLAPRKRQPGDGPPGFMPGSARTPEVMARQAQRAKMKAAAKANNASPQKSEQKAPGEQPKEKGGE
jgi:hypothetical protein